MQNSMKKFMENENGTFSSEVDSAYMERCTPEYMEDVPNNQGG